VTFTVTGKTGVVSDVTLDWTLSPAQGNAHELSVELIAPDNTLCDVFRAHVVDDTDIAGPYVFNDAYSTLLSNVVASTPSGSAAAGNYRPEYSNTARSFRTTFGSKAPNGTWKLRFTDFVNNAFTASVSAANLSIRTVPAPPSITTVQPNLSLLAGGAVTITGTDFSGTLTVTIGGVAATNVVVVNSTTITCTAPVGSVGTKNIVVTNANGSATLTNGYRYTDLIVTSTADTGSGTLREALSDAQTLSGANTITFAAGISGQTITLTTTPIVVGSGFVTDDTGGVILDASSLANGLTLTTNLTNTRIFYARTGSLTLRNLTIANAGGAMPGGGIFSSAILTLERCTLNNNSAAGQEGGAIYSHNTATLVQCSLTGNLAGNGAGIHNNGTLTVRHCTIAGNTANVGGGIFMETGMTLENSIVAGNTANFGLDIYNVTPLTRVGANIVQTLHTSSGLTGSGSILSAAPLLGTFGTHGGPTKTFPLLAGSPAINAAVGSSITSDQRGSAIVGIPDIGAYEAPSTPPTVASPTSASVAFTTATLGGNVSNDGGAAITERGVVFSITTANNNPLIGGSGVTKATSSGTTGVFTVNVTSLTAGSAYSFKAYAINSQGTTYTSVATFNTTALPPEIDVTPAGTQNLGLQRMGVASAPRTFTIQNQGNGPLSVTSVTTTGDKAGDFLVNTSGMLSSVPALSSTTFTIVFNPTGTGDRATTLRILSSDADESTINIPLAGVGSDTDPPTVTEPASGVPLATTVTLGATVASQGALTERGFVVSLTSANSNPFIGGTGVTKFIASGLSSGAFTAAITGLTGGSAYTFKAYATNTGGTSYSSSATFTTPSGNANLSALTVSAGALSPGFASGTLQYTMSLTNSTTSLTLTPTRAQAQATIQVRVGTGGFLPVTSGTASAALALSVGENAIRVRVTAQDGTTQDYDILATRQPSTDANLSALTLSSGTLSPAFAAATTAYTASVSNTTTSLSVTPTVAQANATVSVNGTPINSGTASASLPLTIGANTITILVTAQDTAISRSYGLTVTRAGPPNTAPSFALPGGGGFVGSEWQPRLQESLRYWQQFAISADGQRIYGTENERIWASTDGGVTWTIRRTIVENSFGAICCSADGLKVTTTDGLGALHTSTDGGTTWLVRNVSPTVQQGFFHVVCSTDGTKLFLSRYGDKLYTSTNQGLTITPRESTRQWESIATSGDGTRLFALGGNGSEIQLFVSTNSGTTWTARRPRTAANDFTQPNFVACSLDASRVYVASFVSGEGYAEVSTDQGTTFTRLPGTPAGGFYNLYCSHDGSKLVGANRGATDIWTSANSGQTWAATPSVSATYSFPILAIAGSGSRVVAASLEADRAENDYQIYQKLWVSGAAASAAQSAFADSGERRVEGFASQITKGATAAEASQTVSFVITTDNNALFATLPAISSDGTLTWTPSSVGGLATVSVRAQDNGGTANGGVDSSAVQTFTVTVLAPVNVDLASLAISAGTLTPVFDAGTTSYTATVPSTTASVTLTATVAEPLMKLSINGISTASGTASPALPLVHGANTLTAAVSNANGTLSQAYTITVTRTPVVPALGKATLTAISAISASLTGTLTAEGGSDVTERGFVYALTSANADPLIGGSGVTKVVASAAFAADFSALLENSGYSFKSYAINGVGTAYSAVDTFTTPAVTRPEITTVQPRASLAAGGGSITFTGRYFTGVTSVTIGGVAATGISVANDTTLTATIPAGSLGSRDIVMINAVGTGTARNAFRYVDLTVAHAAEFGPGSLREALRAAADCAGANVITFAPALATQTMRLNPVSVPGTSNDSAFVIDDLGGVTLEGNGLTLTKATPSLKCRAFHLRSGVLTLRGLTLSGLGGSASGGAIRSSGTLTIERCTLNSNAAEDGGAIFNENGTLTVLQSTLTQNRSSSGGAIFNDGSLVLRHCTIAGNSANFGGGIHMVKAMTIENSIVASNTASRGADINNLAALTRVGASIVPNLRSGSSLTGSGTSSTADPLLTGLAANGGLTRTMGLQAGSPAINAAVGSSITSDQRGQAVSVSPDIGAFELPPSLPVLGVASSGNVSGTTATLTGRLASNGGAPILERGFVYALTSVNGAPQIDGNGVTKVIAGSHAFGVFPADLTSLSAGSGYSFSAYSTNLVGTGYSPVATFTTVSRNADLSALTLSASTLSPSFASATTSYTASVGNNITSLTIGTTPAQADAKASVNSGPPGTSAIVPLTVGSNVITILVTAQDTSATNTYTLTVTRAPGVPVLANAQRAVTAASSITVRGSSLSDGGAAITERGIVIALFSANNNPTIGGSGVTKVVASTVIANDFTAIASSLAANSRYALCTYATNSAGTGYSAVDSFDTVSANADLSAIALSVGSLTPGFSAGTLNYTTSVDATELSLTPTTAEAGAAVRVNNEGVVSGVQSRPIRLNSGVNQVTLIVTAADGVTTKTYTIAVSRAPRPPVLAVDATKADLLATTATLGGLITADNGAPITERGIVFSLTSANSNPIINGTGVTKVPAGGTANGAFTAAVTGLATISNYSFKAYATNSAGSGYSSVNTFATGTGTPNQAPSFTLPANSVNPAGVTWTQVTTAPTGAFAVDVSDDGMKLILAAGGRLHTSTDAGAGFTQRVFNHLTSYIPPGGWTYPWDAAAISNDGQRIYASAMGRMVLSTNSGATFTQNRSHSRSSILVSCSDDGQSAMIAGRFAGELFSTTDSGGAWKARLGAGYWIDLDVSSDGSKIILAPGDLQSPELKKLSTASIVNDVITWKERSGPGEQTWGAVAISGNGQTMLAGAKNGVLWISRNGGDSWTQGLADASRKWNSVAMSKDGKVMAAGTEEAFGPAPTYTPIPGKMWTSNDFGVTWVERTSAGVGNWADICFSADAQRIFAVNRTNQLLWTSAGSALPYTITVLPGSGTFTQNNLATNLRKGTNEDNQRLTFLVTTDNDALFRVLPTLSSTGTLTFAPGTAPGEATVTVRLQDDGGTAGGGVDTSPQQSFVIKLSGDDNIGTWSTAAWTDDSSSGLLPDKTIWARHFGSTAPATVNSVSVPGITNMTGNNQHFNLDAPTLYDGDTNTLTSVSGSGSAILGRSFFWGGNPTKITLKGLGVGTDYVVTLLTVGWESAGSRMLHFGSGSNAIQADQSQFGENGGLRVEYSFVADKPTREITIAQANSFGNSFHIYALALRVGGSVVNSAPTGITLARVDIPENSDANAIIGNFRTTDADTAQSHTYTLVPGEGDTGNSSFTLSGNALSLSRPADFERRSSYSIRVASRDNGYPAATVEANFTITITNVDEPGDDIILSTNRFNENIPDYSGIAKITSIGDPDGNNLLAMAAGPGDDDNALFGVLRQRDSTADLRTTNLFPNFEAKNEYRIRVRSGGGSGAFEKALVLYVNDVQEPPTLSVFSNEKTKEDTVSSAIPFTVGDVDAGDVDRLQVTATSSNHLLIPPTGIILAGSGTSRTIQLRPVSDAFGTATITVSVSDGYASVSRGFVFTVEEVDDPMSFEIAGDVSLLAQSEQYFEGFASRIIPGPNEESLGRTFRTRISADKSEMFARLELIKYRGIGTPDTLRVQAASINVTGSAIATITMEEMKGNEVISTATRSFTITFSTNRSPTDITLSNNTVNENVTNLVIGTLTTADLDVVDTHDYSFVNLLDKYDPNKNAFNFFTITGNVLSWKASPNFELVGGRYPIRIRSTDKRTPQAGIRQASIVKDFEIIVNDVNEAPLDITNSRGGVQENRGQGTFVTSLAAVDPDQSQSLTFSLVPGTGDTHNETVELRGNSLFSIGRYNFETTPTLSFRVRATDNGNPVQSLEKVITVPVLNRNDPPTRPVFTLLNFDEGNSDGYYTPSNEPRKIGTLSSTDEDAGGSAVRFTVPPERLGVKRDEFGGKEIVYPDSFYFYTVGNDLMFRGIGDFDSAKKSYSFTVQAVGNDMVGDNDNSVRLSRATVELKLTPVDEPPMFGGLGSVVQRPGAKLLDVFYALQDIDSPNVNITMEFSPDGGATWRGCPSIKGAFGTQKANLWGDRVTPRDDLHPFELWDYPPPSNDRHIEWNIGADWNNQFTNNGRIRLTATSSTNNAVRTTIIKVTDNVDTRFDGPLMISGVVTNKLVGKGWPGVKLQIGTRTGVSDDKGVFFISNAKPGVLTTSHPNFCAIDIDVDAPARGQGVAMPTLGLTPNTEPPVVNFVSMGAAKAPVFLSGVPISSTIKANIQWNTNGIFAFPNDFWVDVSANNRRLNRYTGRTGYDFVSDSFDLGSILTPSLTPGNNKIAVQARNDLGLISKNEEISVSYLPLHPLIDLFRPKSGYEQFTSNHFGFDFGNTDLNYTIENRIIGKWGVVFGTTGSFDYTVNDANWELAYRGGDQKLFGNQTNSHKFFSRPIEEILEEKKKDDEWWKNKFFLAGPDDEDAGKIVLFMGADEREIAFFARANGTLDATKGWTLPDVEGGLILREYGPIAEIGVLDSIPGLQPVARFMDITLTINAGTELGGSARFAPRKGTTQLKDVETYRLKDATLSGALSLRATLEIDAKLAGAEVWVGGRGYGRMGYPSPLVRELDFTISAGYEWYIGFIDDEGEITLAHLNYSAPNDPNKAKSKASDSNQQRFMLGSSPAPSANGANFSLPPLVVTNTRSRGIGPMTRRWRDHGSESFDLADVAAPSTIQQARINKSGLAAAAINISNVPELRAFNRLSQPVTKPVKNKEEINPTFIPTDPVPTQAVLPLISNVFPRSRPVMAEKNGKIMLLYVRDTGASNPYHFSEVAFTYYDGTSWTVPGAIAADTRAQMTPQIAFDGNGNAVAVWSRIKDASWSGLGLIEGQNALIEVVSSTWNAGTGSWTTPVAITDNSVFDHQINLSGTLSDGDLMLTWVSNAGNIVSGTADSPDSFHSARWDAATASWGPSTQVRSGIEGTAQIDLAASGDKAVLAWSQTMTEGEKSSDELWSMTWTSGSWAAPVRLTDDDLRDTDVKVKLNAQGDVFALWMRDENLVMQTNFTGDPRIVRPNSLPGTPDNFALAIGPDDQLMVLWNGLFGDELPDVAYRLYTPSEDSWSEDVRLSNDAQQERFLTPILDRSGNLLIAYLNTEIQEVTVESKNDDGTTTVVNGALRPGRTDLLLARRRMVTDLSVEPESLLANATTWGPGSIVTLTAKLLNTGDKPVTDASIAFYDGDPRLGGSLIGHVVVPDQFKGGTSYTATLDWTIPADTDERHTIFAVADHLNAVEENDETNNRIFNRVGGPDLQITYLGSDVMSDGAANARVRVTNVGSPIAPGSEVVVWDAPTRGALPVAKVNVPALQPLASMEMLIVFPTGTVGSTGRRELDMIVNEAQLVNEPNQANNRTGFVLEGTRPLSSVTGLSNLAVTGSTISPEFATATLGYKATVPFDQTTVTLVPTAVDGFSTIKVNGSAVSSGTLSQVLPLNSGSTQVVIEVISEDLSKTMTYTVDVLRSITNLADTGAGSLRALIAAAALRGGPDTIAIPASMSGQTLRLTGAITVNDPSGLVIDGSALAKGLTIEGSGNHRLFEVAADSSLTLICVTLKSGGGTAFASNGGAIQNNGTLRIERCALMENKAASGGAIHNTSTGTFMVHQSTFAANEATVQGAAVFNEGTANVNFSTLSTNLGGALRSTNRLTLENSIVAMNTGTDVDATGAVGLNYRGMNIVLTRLGITPSGTPAIVSNPLLSTLDDHGGPTLTFVPQAGSPAIDQALTATAPATDQRGLPRPLGISADIGSVEGRVLIVTTQLDEFDPSGVMGAGYSLREAVRDAEDGATILFDRSIFHGAAATTNTITLTRGPLAPRTVVTLDGTLNPGGIRILTSIGITTQPAPVNVAQGGSARFIIAANAVSGGVYYQWRKDGIELNGAVGPIYSISSAVSSNEGLYDVVVTEGSSTGEILLTNVTMDPAMTISQPASLTVGTPALSIVRQPTGAMIPLGGSHTLSVVAIGPAAPAMGYQWRLNGKPVAGATKSNLTLLNAKLTDAGAYTCVVNSGASMATTVATEVGIVDTSAKTVNLIVGGTFTPRVSAAGNNLTYVWRRGSTTLPATTSSFTLSPLASSDSGLYTCAVSGPAGTVDNGFNTTLNVTGRPPTLGSISLPTAYIGQSYFYQIPVLPLAGGPAVSFAVKGALPPDVTLNSATGVLSGRPTATKSGGYALGFTATNLRGTSPESKATLNVVALDALAIGTYAGPAPRSPLNGNLGGRFDLTTTVTGTFSGSVTLGSRPRISFTNMLMRVSAAGDQVLTGSIFGIAMADTAKTPLNAFLEVFVADQTARLTLTHPNGTQLIIPAWRNPWTTARPATAFATNYTLRLDAAQGGETVPEGYGFASFSIAANGNVSLTGKLPDGNTITAGGFVGDKGQVLVFQTLYKNAGSLVGQFDITRAVSVTTNSLVGALTWSKPLVTTDLLYKDGFAPLSVKVEGSAYVRPNAGQRLLGLPATSDNALLDFRLGALSEGWSQPITIVNPSPTGLTNTASVPSTAANGLKVAKLDAATGTFSGSFTLAGTTALLNRPATYEGMIVKVGTVTQGYGFFHLPRVPVGTEKVTTAPRLSGVVELAAP
jgi:hypothetical protein